MGIIAKIFVIIASIVFFILTSKLGGWKKYLSWVLAILLFVSQLYLLYKDLVSENISAKSGKIKGVDSSSANLKLYYGTNLFTTSAPALTDEVLGHFIHPWPQMNSYIRREKGKLIVDITVKDKNGAVVAKLKNNEWILSNEAFDRNFDSARLEVFDKYEDVPILQIMLHEDVIILNGVFFIQGGGKHVATTEGLFINPKEPMRNLIVPWFKYPSTEHPGELIRESVQRSINNLRELQNRLEKIK
jgi:hypothetical protein